MDIEHSRLRLNDDVAFQSMGPGQETVVLSLSSGYLFTCNETTRSFLEAMDGERSVGELVDLLAEQYDVSREQLHSDLMGLAERLIREKLISADAST